MASSTIMLLFGEDENDRRALKHLIQAMITSRTSIAIKPLRKPIILRQDPSNQNKRRKMANEIAAFSKAYEEKNAKVKVVVHRDCDAVEPAHIKAAEDLETELRNSGVADPIAATPAWEMETWWMLFPKQLNRVRTCWKKIDYGRQNVGKFTNSKERLVRDLRPDDKKARKSCPEYTESDGVTLARLIEEDPGCIKQIIAKSNSFDDFMRKILVD